MGRSSESEKDLTGLKKVLDALTDEERFGLFVKYCTSCGSKDTSCRCWDDS